MLFSDHQKDRYCKFTCNQNTGRFERDWIRYADGVYEPVRREGSLSAKWNDRHERCLWWHERKPADWRPWDEGFGFSWNHTLGEKNKPADYGSKSEAEAAAGSAPYFMEIEPGPDGRIASRTERIDGRRETWRFSYDGDGRLTSCLATNGWAQDFEYDEQGRRSADYAVGRQPFKRAFAYDEADRLLSAGTVAYEHDALGFRSARREGEAVTRYHYAPDYRLLGAELPDGRVIEMEHNDNGQRILKLVNGTPVEAYRWHDFIRLAGFLNCECEQEFLYEGDTRLPYAVRINATTLTLEYDQIGSLKAVVDETGNVVKAIQYDSFGNILWDSNPGLRIPLGFGGGLSDPDLGFVRFGWRDYDPDTGRWTAQDPIGAAGGDTDWYGYCLDDPINGVDPAGLKEIRDYFNEFFAPGIEGIRLGNEAVNTAIKKTAEPVVGPEGVTWGGKGRSVIDGPKHGNWGGKKHSGGFDGKQPPVNSADEKYMEHDLNYDNAMRTPILGDVKKTQKTMIREADKKLFNELSELPDDSANWDKPPAKGDRNGSEWFRKKAIWWFGD